MSDEGAACRWVRARLGDDPRPRWQRRLRDRHLGRCADCALAAVRQETVDRTLERLAAERDPAVEPPQGLLEDLLTRTAEPGLRERAAVPARGAVSGARPALTVGGLVTAALLGAAIGYALWRLARRLGG